MSSNDVVAQRERKKERGGERERDLLCTKLVSLKFNCSVLLFSILVIIDNDL